MKHPDRPDITVPNHKNVHTYFAGNERDTEGRNTSLDIFSKLIRPEVEWIDGARQELEEIVDADTRVLFLMNHTNNFDSMTLGGLFWTDPLLRKLIDRTRIAGKYGLFSFGPFADRIEDIGTVPIPRPKDMDDEVTAEVLKSASDGFLDFVDESIRVRGEDWILYPGGERNKKNRTTMPKPMAGAARMLVRANDLDDPLATVCIGDYHPPFSLGNLRDLNRPSLVIGRPDQTRWEKRNAATVHIQEGIQANLTQAHANFEQRQELRRAA